MLSILYVASRGAGNERRESCAGKWINSNSTTFGIQSASRISQVGDPILLLLLLTSYATGLSKNAHTTELERGQPLEGIERPEGSLNKWRGASVVHVIWFSSLLGEGP